MRLHVGVGGEGTEGFGCCFLYVVKGQSSCRLSDIVESVGRLTSANLDTSAFVPVFVRL